MDRCRREDTRADLLPGHAHLVGIARRGMTGLAQLLAQRGVVVTGSDGSARGSGTVDRLRQLGARVHSGHAARRGPSTAQFLVYAPEIGRDHPERLTAARRGIAQTTPTQWMARLIRRGLGLTVAGRRDAGVAAAMIGWTLTRAGFDPTVVLGTSVPQLGGWARWGQGPHIVVGAVGAADELEPLAPRLAVVLDVEAGTGAARFMRADSLGRFVTSVPRDGCILALWGDELAIEAIEGCQAEVEWLSLQRGADWWGADLREDRGRYRFRAFHRGRFVVEVRLQVPGHRNVICALAAVAACHRLEVPTAEIKQALEEFAGLARDFESRGSYRGATLIDDEGQDSSSVFETLVIGRQVFGPRRLWAVFGGSGVESGVRDEARFVSAFEAADHVLITDGAAARSLVRALVAAGVQARWMASLDHAISDLDQHLEPGDVLVTLGAGDVGTIADAFIRRLSRDRQGQ